MIDVLIMTPSLERRESLVTSLRQDPAIRFAGWAGTLPALRSLMAETKADVAVIDWQSKPSPAAREWLFEVLEVTAVVLLCSEPGSKLSDRMLHVSSGGMLQASAPPSQILRAVQAVAAGLQCFDSVLLPRSNAAPLPEPLTPRENDVLHLLADGLGNKEIAARLNISEHTIKFHIRSIMGKLGAVSRTEAVSRGLRSGLIAL
jgi:DNA-binding NarL/FixJ family response regulator